MSDLTRYRRTIGNKLQSGNVTITLMDGSIIDGHVHWIPDSTLQDIADAWTAMSRYDRSDVQDVDLTLGDLLDALGGTDK